VNETDPTGEQRANRDPFAGGIRRRSFLACAEHDGLIGRDAAQSVTVTTPIVPFTVTS
jgi:hypothetical protein